MFSLILNCNQTSHIVLGLERKSQIYGVLFRDMSLQQKQLLNIEDLVLVLGGGDSSERDVSFASCESVINSLINLKYNVCFIDVQQDIVEILSNIKSNFRVFNLIHGKWGEDGYIQSVLNIMGIKYTGSGTLASSMSFNKKIAYQIVKFHGININDYQILSKNSPNLHIQNVQKPFILKPTTQGSSIGVELISSEDDFILDNYSFPYGDEVILEKFVEGQELQVAMFEGEFWGILEIHLLNNKRIYDYQTKYNVGFADHIYPARISEDLFLKIKHISEKIYSIFGFKGLVRIEFIYDTHNKILYFLEVNTVPGMTNTSICPEIAAHIGIGYDDLVDKMINSAHYEQ